MLGVFRANLKKLPLPPEMPGDGYDPAMGGNLELFFTDNFNHAVVTILGKFGYMAYSADLQISPSPGPLYCMKGGISCIYRGGTNLMKKGKMVEETGNEVDDLIKCYKNLKEKGYKTPFEAMKVICADFNYILYDSSPGWESVFVVHCWDGEDVYYGYDSLGICVIADNPLVMMEACGESYKTIPKGKGLLIPVVEKSEIQQTEVGSLGVTDPTESAGKTTEAYRSCGSSSVANDSKAKSIEAKPSDGISPNKTSGGKAVEGIPSGDRGIMIISDNEAVTVTPSGSKSLTEEESGKAKSSDYSSPKKTIGGNAVQGSPFGGRGSTRGSGGKRSAASPSGGRSSVVYPSIGRSIKVEPSDYSSPKKTSGGNAVEGSPLGGSGSKKASGEKRSVVSPSGGRSSIVGLSIRKSIKVESSDYSSPKKTSGGDADLKGSPLGGSGSTKGSGEKRSAASPGGSSSSSKKARG